MMVNDKSLTPVERHYALKTCDPQKTNFVQGVGYKQVDDGHEVKNFTEVKFMVDEDMRNTMQIYRDLQAEFRAVHQNVENLRAESMNPNELKKEITQLEQEKEQLLTKINHFKNKGNREDF